MLLTVNKIRRSDPTPTAEKIIAVGMGEYYTTYLTNHKKLYRVVWKNNVPVFEDTGLQNIIDVDGAQYTNIALDNNGVAYVIGGNGITTYATDNFGNPLNAVKVYGLYQSYLAINSSGEILYWSKSTGVNDFLNQQGGNGDTLPTRLNKPLGKTFVKLAMGSPAPVGTTVSSAKLFGLATDGTVWQWDRTRTTPIQVTGFVGPAVDVAMCAGDQDVVVVTENDIYAWTYQPGQWRKMLTTGQDGVLTPTSIKSIWQSAGCVFPLKEVKGYYSGLSVIDANDNLFASGVISNGEIGDGSQYNPWRLRPGAPWLWNLNVNSNSGDVVVGPKRVHGAKMKNLQCNTSLAIYRYAQDLGGNWYSWGRNKSFSLGNGKTLSVNDYATYPNMLDIPAPRLVDPLTQKWSVLSPNTTAIQPPIANAGVNQYLPEGVTNTTLYGSGTAQQEGTITSYSWTKVSGSGNITSPNSMNTNVTGLASGNNVFMLTVTNNHGLTDSMTVSVVVGVTNTPSTPPTVSAGSNQTLYTPTNTTTLSGSAIDDNASITSVLWTKESGPSCTIVSPTSLTTTVNGLVAGVYVFKLTVTNNLGLSSFATVTITVDTPQTGQNLIDLGGWNAYVKLPDDYHLNPTTYYPTIIFFPGLGEVGTNASKLLSAGPSAYINGGWNGNVTVDGNIVKFIVISVQPSTSYPHETVIHSKINALKSLYRIDNKKMHLTGLSHGGWCSTRYAAYYPDKVASIVNVQGVQPFYTNEYATVFANWVNSGGKCLNLEQNQDFRDMYNLTNALNSIKPNSAIYIQTNFGNGGHCCWNSFYGGNTAPSNFNINSKTENIYQWMARQSLP